MMKNSMTLYIEAVEVAETVISLLPVHWKNLELLLIIIYNFESEMNIEWWQNGSLYNLEEILYYY